MRNIVMRLCEIIFNKVREITANPLEHVYTYIDPIVKILEKHGHAELASQLQDAPAISQSAVECLGQTRDIACMIAQHSFAKDLNINKDLEYIAKYCQRVMRSR